MRFTGDRVLGGGATVKLYNPAAVPVSFFDLTVPSPLLSRADQVIE